MKQFRKRPVVVEAVQWDGTPETAGPVINWVLESGGTARYDDYSLSLPVLRIDTLEGTMVARAGWWVIRGVHDEFYPCEPTIFDETYEAEPWHCTRDNRTTPCGDCDGCRA